MSTPALTEVLRIWHDVVQASDPYLDGLDTDLLLSDLPFQGRVSGQSIGSAMRRITYHYWYHIGETQAIRQLLGHHDLPEYVGDLEKEGPYRSE
jgi:hypothetical protein